MRIITCTITGVDDGVLPANLAALSAEYSFVEWGVAYNPSYAGQPRYPTLSWVDGFVRAYPHIKKAMHLSGSGLSELANGQAGLLHRAAFFPRMQLNFDLACEKNQIDKLAQQAQAMAHKQFIFPYNDGSKTFLSRFKSKNISVLFDASGGQGKSPLLWPRPLTGYACGYAGGIGPDNIECTLDALTDVIPFNDDIWIDMESGVRTDNRLDLDKVVRILETLKVRFFL
jgi:hypothetical protein